jgi:outer membrane lipoprotein-sorting protein
VSAHLRITFAFLIVSLGLFCSCSSSRQAADNTTANNQIVTSTPPFKTKEPDHYQALRTITSTDSSGASSITKTLIARDGVLRREEIERGSSPKIVMLELEQGRFVLLPDAKIYTASSDAVEEANQDLSDSGGSPERLLHQEPIATSYQTIGSETIAGRSTTKYRIIVNISTSDNVSRSETFMWIDENYGMPIRSETKTDDGNQVVMELSNITLSVDKSLFRMPEGYEKVATFEFRRRLGKTESR